MIPDVHSQVLSRIVAALTDKPIHWAVTGSLGMALQGIPLEIHDIDIQTDKAGAFEFERIFSDYLISPVQFRESDRLRSFLGKFNIMGIQVEVMGDIQKRLPSQRWDKPVNVTEHTKWLEYAGMHVPVLSIEYEYQAYLAMGRLERAKVLKAWLEKPE